jgi:hypothetical protein
MRNLSASTEHALSVVAHASMAKGMASNVEGFAGFYKYWLKEQTRKDIEIIEAFNNLSIKARKDLSAMIAKDLKDSNE